MSCGFIEYQRMFIYHDLPSSTFPNIWHATWPSMFQHLNNTFGYISYIFLHILFMLHLINFDVYIYHTNVMLQVMSYGFHCITMFYHTLNKCYYIACIVHIVSSHHTFNYIIIHVAQHFTSSQMTPHCK
jgi:hypothetical protein